MSENMVESVARAICRQAGYGPNEEDVNWDRYVQYARAAIEAMREPTEAMEDAAFSSTLTIPKRGYQAMIDAALKD